MKHFPVRKERGRREESESEKYEHTLAIVMSVEMCFAEWSCAQIPPSDAINSLAHQVGFLGLAHTWETSVT